MGEKSMIWAARAWLFDMDGVLVDNCRYHVLAWLEFAKRHGYAITERQVIDWMGAPARDYIVRMAGRELPAEELTRQTKEKERLYREIYAPQMRVPAGLERLLDAAVAREIKLAVATGGSSDNVNFVLDGTGLRRYFPTVVDASRYARGKPRPDCYLKAAELVGVPPAECVVFEDAVNGLEAARVAGMRTVAIVTTNSRSTLESAGATLVVDSFAEL